MADGCTVVDVMGLAMSRDGNGAVIVDPDFPDPAHTVDAGSHGFTISRPAADSRNLAAAVHLWHDTFSASRAKIVYVVDEPYKVDCVVPGLADSP